MISSQDENEEFFNFDEFYTQRRLVAENYFLPALTASGIDFSSMTALEIGCGRGIKINAFGGLFRRYIGVDLDDAEIKIAAEDLKKAGRENCEVFCANFMDVLENPDRFGLDGEPDFLVLYAVLEHMLPHERREALRLAARIFERGGAVFFGETPNRLIPFDSHSSHLHFGQSLPPELLLRYLATSPHRQWMRSFKRMGADLTALYRSGLGLSYHDFELDFLEEGNTSQIPFAFTGWSGPLMSHQPLQNDEIWLHRYIKDNSLPVHPAFTRNWIEGVVSRQAPLVHRWSRIGKLVGQPPSKLLSRPPFWALDQWNAESPYAITANFSQDEQADSYEYVFQMEMAASTGVIHIMAGTSILAELDLDELKKSRVWAWHQILVFSLTFARFYPTLTIRLEGADARIGLQAVILNGSMRRPSDTSA